jgi:hypothetical protein
MTCGVCGPEAFRDALDLATGARAFGYTNAATPQGHVRSLYFHGASFVSWDSPSPTRVLKREGLKQLRQVLRQGDVLLIARAADLGALPASRERAMQALEGDGVRVSILTDTASH